MEVVRGPGHGVDHRPVLQPLQPLGTGIRVQVPDEDGEVHPDDGQLLLIGEKGGWMSGSVKDGDSIPGGGGRDFVSFGI